MAVQHKKGRLHGKCHESVGYWFPDHSIKSSRSIILNKHRLRYWLKVGGRITPAIHKLLNIGGMMNHSWIRNGRCTLYKAPEKGVQILKEMTINRDKWFRMKPELYKLAREQEEENLLLRKIKEDQAVLDFAINRLDAEDLDPSEVLDNIDDILVRSKSFYRLSDMMEQMNDTLDHSAPATRKLIQYKLKKLAKEGILPREQADRRVEELFSMEDETETARKKALILKMKQGMKNLDDLNFELQPMAKEEFRLLAAEKYMSKDPADIDRYVDALYERFASMNIPFTRFSSKRVLNLEKDREIGNLPLNTTMMLKYGDVVMPVQPVTPMPDYFEYQPNDFYDLRVGPSTPYDTSRTHSEWFDPSPQMKKKLATVAELKDLPQARNKGWFKMLGVPSKSFGPKFERKLQLKHKADKKNFNRYLPESQKRASMDEIMLGDSTMRRPTSLNKKSR